MRRRAWSTGRSCVDPQYGVVRFHRTWRLRIGPGSEDMASMATRRFPAVEGQPNYGVLVVADILYLLF